MGFRRLAGVALTWSAWIALVAWGVWQLSLVAFCGGAKGDDAIRACTVMMPYALAINGDLGAVHVARGVAYLRKRLYDQAIADFSSAIALNSWSADKYLAAAYIDRGIAYRRQGAYAQAIADETKAISLRPTAANAYVERALDDEHVGRLDLMIADNTQALRIRPNSAVALNDRAWGYHLIGEDARGLADAERAAALAPHNSDALETRAEIYEKLGRWDEARAGYWAVLKVNPGDPFARSGLASLGAAP